MPRLSAGSCDVWHRATRILTAALLAGGMVAGPLAHMVIDHAGAGHATPHGQLPDGHDHGRGPHDCHHPGHTHGPAGPGNQDNGDLPDAHDDCIVCLTLAAGVAPLVPGAPMAASAYASADVASADRFHGQAGTDTRRARAPPHA